MSYAEGWLDELVQREQSGAPPRRTAASSGRAASPPASTRPAGRASPGASRPPRHAHRAAASRAPSQGTAGCTPTQAVRSPSPAAAAAGAAALARHQQAAGNAGSWPPVAPAQPEDGPDFVFQPDPDIADFVLLDTDLAPTPVAPPAGGGDVGPGAPDTAADELLARLLQQEEEEMLIGLNDEDPMATTAATTGLARPPKELDPDLYTPATYTADGAAAAGLPPPLVPALPPRPAYATYAQEDDTLLEAYRDLNRRRGLDDRDDNDGSGLLTFLPPSPSSSSKTRRGGPPSRAGQPARQVAQEECGDLDAVDELDLSNLDRYSLRVLQEYCRLENVAVHGSTKQDYINAIQAYNDDMMDENDEDELSISELVERTQLEDLAVEDEDERHRRLAREEADILRLLPPPPTTATVTTSRGRASRPVIILDDESESESESESDKESEIEGLSTARAPPSAGQAKGSWELTDDEMRALGLLSSAGPESAVIIGDRDDEDEDDEDDDDRHNPFYPHPLGAAPPLPSRRQRHMFDVPTPAVVNAPTLSEDEELERAIRESMLEHQRRQPQPQPQPQSGHVATAGGTGDAAAMSDEELARALQEELDRSMSDERIARELQRQIEREEAEVNNRTTRPVGDTTAILMSMAERNRELREQTEALRNSLLLRQPPTAAANRRGSAAALSVNEPAAATSPSYFRRNFVEVQPQASRAFGAREQDDDDDRRNTLLLAAAAAAAATGGEPSAVTRNRRWMPSRHRHRDLLLDGAADLDNMSYEQLLALGERMGEAKAKGASQTTITSTTQTYRYRKPTSASADSDNAKCSVCMDDFAEGDEVRMLPCIHAYHRACIDQWLVKKAACPVCQRPLEEEEASS